VETPDTEENTAVYVAGIAPLLSTVPARKAGAGQKSKYEDWKRSGETLCGNGTGVQ